MAIVILLCCALLAAGEKSSEIPEPLEIDLDVELLTVRN